YTEGNIKTSEIYGESLPIRITLSSLDSIALGKRIKIEVKNKNKYLLIDEEGEQEYSFGMQVKKSYATFTLTALGDKNEGKVIWIQFNNLERMAASLNQAIAINPVNKDASVLTITLVNAIPEKAED